MQHSLGRESMQIELIKKEHGYVVRKQAERLNQKVLDLES